MQARSSITDISAEMDVLYGKVGTPKREQFRREAYAFCGSRGIRTPDPLLVRQML